jgi:hypothetical protein
VNPASQVRFVGMDTIELTVDPVIEAYKSGIDMTLVRENLRRSPEERLRALEQLQAFAEELRRGGRAMLRGRQ